MRNAKKLISVILCFVMLASCFAVASLAYESKVEARPPLEEIFAKVKYLGDANHDGEVLADDARAILRYSADLDPDIEDTLSNGAKNKLDIDGDEIIRAEDRDLIYDIDGDGVVTAIDARIALRISAGLDDLNDCRGKYALQLFNESINNIKVPNDHGHQYAGLSNYYYGEEKKTDNILIDNEAALNNFSTQMNALIKAMDDSSESIDLASSLKQDINVVTYASNNGATAAYSDSKYIPIKGRKECSFLTPADVISATFNDSTNYNFASYYTENGVKKDRHSVVKQGLYSVTVTIAPDDLSANNYPSDLVRGSHAGKVFNLPDKSNVDAAYQEIQELQAQMNSYKEESNWLTNVAALKVNKFNLSVNFTSMNVSGSTVTLYINPENGLTVGADYKLTYDLKVHMYLDIDMRGGALVSGKDVIVENQNINITNKLYTRTRILIGSLNDA